MNNNKIKVLLVGNQDAIIDDFFIHTDDDFICISSSDRKADIEAHISFFAPEVFAYCMGKDIDKDMDNLRLAMRIIKDSQAISIVIGDGADISAIPPMVLESIDMSFSKPISIKNIAKDIVHLIESKRIEQENKRLEEERARVVEEQQDKKHILVVDDDPTMLRTIKRYLEDKYIVATAPSGKFAMKYLSQKPADIILLDYEMPGMGGPEVFEAIKSDPNYENIPVVFLTGISDSNKIKSVLAMKPNAYLLKPVECDRLCQTIESIIG